MGLDMYIDKRSTKYNDADYNLAQEIRSRVANYNYAKKHLELVKNCEQDKAMYVDTQYPDLFKDDDLFGRGLIFCGSGFLTGSKPILYVEPDSPHVDPVTKYDERYDWKVKNFTKEQVIDLVYNNDHTRFTNALVEFSKGPTLKGYEKIEGVEVAYWRKSNHIHAWLIENGTEKDEDYYCHISIDKLKELKQICTSVLDDRSLADTLLPTQSGFFFGSTSYDEYYYQDLNDTIEQLNGIIDAHKDTDRYVYIASY